MIAIFFNNTKDCKELVIKIRKFLILEKVPHFISGRFPFTNSHTKALKKSSLLIVVGGDGTVLKSLSLAKNYSIPVMPIHFGTVGFICSVRAGSVIDLLKKWIRTTSRSDRTINPGYRIDSRSYMLIRYEKREYYAFNDAVISRGSTGKLLSIDTYINGVHSTAFRADGLILSTATGSTAYNLSAGGPILHPELDALVFNPICPHSFTHKPIVIPGHDIISVKIDTQPARLEIDGDPVAEIKKNKSVTFCLADKKIDLIKPLDENYYSILREKLKWGI